MDEEREALIAEALAKKTVILILNTLVEEYDLETDIATIGATIMTLCSQVSVNLLNWVGKMMNPKSLSQKEFLQDSIDKISRDMNLLINNLNNNEQVH